ncbi:MAG: helix-hairpin-helix domain-containing protein [Bacteroidaceae bacterium]|nr:helix-hairpin-helix domain-containing protein [Bacteroidaceae bacterium]
MKFFHRNTAERRGVIALLAVLFGVTLALFFRGRTRESAPATDSDRTTTVKQKPSRYYSQPARTVETFDFDPNTADSTALLRLGLTPSMVRGIYRYRARGYAYSTVEDFSHVPGMTRALWQRLSPHVRIGEAFQPMTPLAAPRRKTDVPSWEERSADTAAVRPASSLRQVKLKEGETLDLNTADTAQLKMIPGIGSYYARRIVDYRSRLGGFASAAQLAEIDGMPEQAQAYVTVDTSKVVRIDVNHCARNVLMRHPYMSGYRALSIWSYRHNMGPITSIETLRSLPDFTENDVRRLEPYLQFGK